MALVIEGEERIAAPVQKVWEEMKSATEMAATVVLKIGPIKATFNGEVTLKNLKPPHAYTIQGEGKGGIAGFAKGGADVTLTADGPDATV
ncbi:MAG: carbon monoxide dehydrogenase, partial [Mesorhizobium sp.]